MNILKKLISLFLVFGLAADPVAAAGQQLSVRSGVRADRALFECQALAAIARTSPRTPGTFQTAAQNRMTAETAMRLWMSGRPELVPSISGGSGKGEPDAVPKINIEFKPGMHVIDLGAGLLGARWGLELARSGLYYTGVDDTARHMEAANKDVSSHETDPAVLARISLRVHDFLKPPMPADIQKADVVTLNSPSPHIYLPQNLVLVSSVMHESLKEGGWAFIFVEIPSPLTPKYLSDFLRSVFEEKFGVGNVFLSQKPPSWYKSELLGASASERTLFLAAKKAPSAPEGSPDRDRQAAAPIPAEPLLELRAQLEGLPPEAADYLETPHYNAVWHHEGGREARLKTHLTLMLNTAYHAEDDTRYGPIPQEIRDWTKTWITSDRRWLIEAFVLLHDIGKKAKAHLKDDKVSYGFPGHEEESVRLITNNPVRYQGRPLPASLIHVIKYHGLASRLRTSQDWERFREDFYRNGGTGDFSEVAQLFIIATTLDLMSSLVDDEGHYQQSDQPQTLLRLYHEWKSSQPAAAPDGLDIDNLPPSSGGNHVTEPTRSPGSPKPVHILVVDDTEPFRTMAQEHLESEGFKVITAACEQAFELLAPGGIDVVFMDLSEPARTNGMELIRTAKADSRFQRIPFYAWTIDALGKSDLLEMTNQGAEVPFIGKNKTNLSIFVRRVRAAATPVTIAQVQEALKVTLGYFQQGETVGIAVEKYGDFAKTQPIAVRLMLEDMVALLGIELVPDKLIPVIEELRKKLDSRSGDLPMYEVFPGTCRVDWQAILAAPGTEAVSESFVRWDEIDYKKLGKPVLVAVNVDTVKGGKIKDSTKIDEALKGLEDIEAPLVFVSHNGRPSEVGKEGLSLAPVAEYIQKQEKWRHKRVVMASGLTGPHVEEQIKQLKPNDVLVLENFRFDERAESDSAEDRQGLAHSIVFGSSAEPLFSLYINNDFASTYRDISPSPSTRLVDFADDLPSVAGPLLIHELEQLEQARSVSDHPYVLAIGGSKVGDKVQIISRPLSRMGPKDTLILRGLLAYPFLAVQHEFGHPAVRLGKNAERISEQELHAARAILKLARERGVRVILPVDHVVADDLKSPTKTETTMDANIPEGMYGGDIGPRTLDLIKKAFAEAKLIFFNGSPGAFDLNDLFQTGTVEEARAAAEAKQHGARVIAGGGDTIKSLALAGVKDALTHVSTGGGASMQFMGLADGEDLKPVAALKRVAERTRTQLPLKTAAAPEPDGHTAFIRAHDDALSGYETGLERRFTRLDAKLSGRLLRSAPQIHSSQPDAGGGLARLDLEWIQKQYIPVMTQLMSDVQAGTIRTGQQLLDWVATHIAPVKPGTSIADIVVPDEMIGSDQMEALSLELNDRVFIPRGFVVEMPFFYSPQQFPIGRILESQELVTPAGRKIPVYTVQTLQGNFGGAAANSRRIVRPHEEDERLRTDISKWMTREKQMKEGSIVMRKEREYQFYFRLFAATHASSESPDAIFDRLRQTTLQEELAHVDAIRYAYERLHRHMQTAKDNTDGAVFLLRSSSRFSAQLREFEGRYFIGPSLFELEAKLHAMASPDASALEALKRALLDTLLREPGQPKPIPTPENAIHGLAYIFILQELSNEFHLKSNDLESWMDFLEKQLDDLPVFEARLRKAARAIYDQNFYSPDERAQILVARAALDAQTPTTAESNVTWQVGDKVRDTFTHAMQVIDQVDVTRERVHFEGDGSTTFESFGRLSSRYERLPAAPEGNKPLGQIGKRVKVRGVVERNGKKFLQVGKQDDSETIRDIELTSVPTERLEEELERLYRPRRLRFLLNQMQKAVREKVPEVYTFSETVEDLGGWASASAGIIAIHEALAGSPLAWFHEIGEFLFQAGIFRVISKNKGNYPHVRYKVGSRRCHWYLTPGAWELIRNSDDPHVFLRAYQRDYLLEEDTALSSLIVQLVQSAAPEPQYGTPSDKSRLVLDILRHDFKIPLRGRSEKVYAEASEIPKANWAMDRIEDPQNIPVYPFKETRLLTLKYPLEALPVLSGPMGGWESHVYLGFVNEIADPVSIKMFKSRVSEEEIETACLVAQAGAREGFHPRFYGLIRSGDQIGFVMKVARITDEGYRYLGDPADPYQSDYREIERRAGNLGLYPFRKVEDGRVTSEEHLVTIDASSLWIENRSKFNQYIQIHRPSPAAAPEPEIIEQFGPGVRQHVYSPEEGIRAIKEKILQLTTSAKARNRSRIFVIVDGQGRGIGKSTFVSAMYDGLQVPGWAKYRERISGDGYEIVLSQGLGAIGGMEQEFAKGDEDQDVVAIYLATDPSMIPADIHQHADYILDWRPAIRPKEDDKSRELLNLWQGRPAAAPAEQETDRQASVRAPRPPEYRNRPSNGDSPIAWGGRPLSSGGRKLRAWAEKHRDQKSDKSLTELADQFDLDKGTISRIFLEFNITPRGRLNSNTQLSAAPEKNRFLQIKNESMDPDDQVTERKEHTHILQDAALKTVRELLVRVQELINFNAGKKPISELSPLIKHIKTDLERLYQTQPIFLEPVTLLQSVNDWLKRGKFDATKRDALAQALAIAKTRLDEHVESFAHADHSAAASAPLPTLEQVGRIIAERQRDHGHGGVVVLNEKPIRVTINGHVGHYLWFYDWEHDWNVSVVTFNPSAHPSAQWEFWGFSTNETYFRLSRLSLFDFLKQKLSAFFEIGLVDPPIITYESFLPSKNVDPQTDVSNARWLQYIAQTSYDEQKRPAPVHEQSEKARRAA